MILRVAMVLACLACLSGILVGLLAFFMGPSGYMGYFFKPIKELVTNPAEAGLDYRDVTFEAADGTKLHGWFVPAKNERLGSVLFLHGNSENISTHFERVAWLPENGFDIFLIDYRGYGRSEGAPTLDGLHEDVAAGLETLIAMPGVQPGNVVVFAQSLGGTVALTAISENSYKDRLAGLIIEGAFSSYRRIAREKMNERWSSWAFQWPISLGINVPYDPKAAARAMSPLPLLIVHGQADDKVGPHHGKALFEAAAEPKMIWLPEDTGHVTAFTTSPMQKRLLDHIISLIRGKTEVLQK